MWRGYVFARLRDRTGFTAAVWWSMPLITLTHTPIVLTDGWLVGGLATLTAALTGWPLAHLWERGGQTICAPALMHGLIGTWQMFQRTYPPSLSMLVLVASSSVPLRVFVPALRHARRPRISDSRDHAPVVGRAAGSGNPIRETQS